MARIISFPRRPLAGKPLNAASVTLGLTTVACALALAAHQTGHVYLMLFVATAAFGGLVWLELRRRRLRAGHVVVCGALMMVLAIAFPMRTSRDIWAYADYGQMIARYDASPYTHVPADFPDDFWYQHVNERWQRTGSVYGPLFAGTAGLFMEVAGDSMLVTRLMFQSLAAAIVAFIAWLVWRRTRDPMALAIVLVNPLVVVSVVNGGHNDPLVGLAIVAGVLLIEGRKPGPAGVVLAVGALVKVVAVVPAAAAVFWLWRRRSAKEALACAAPFAGVFLLVIGLAGGMDVFRPLRGASELVSFSSFWHAVLKVASGGTFQGDAAATGRAIVRVLSGATVLVLTAVTLLARTKRSGERVTVATVTLVYLIAASYVLPWYVMWALPLCAIAWRSRLSLVAIAYSSALALSYFPLSTRTGSWIRAIRTGMTGLMGPIEIAALVAVVGLSLTRVRRRLAAAA